MKPILSDLVHTLFFKSPDIAISLSYRFIRAGALGALGRRFESCRPDHLNQVILASYPDCFFIGNYVGYFVRQKADKIIYSPELFDKA